MHTENLTTAVQNFPRISIIWCPKDNTTMLNVVEHIKKAKLVLSEMCLLLQSQKLIQAKTSQIHKHTKQSV